MVKCLLRQREDDSSCKSQVMSRTIEKAEKHVWVSHIATSGHTPLQPLMRKKGERKKQT